MFKATSFIFDGISSEDFFTDEKGEVYALNRICFFNSNDTVNSTLWDGEINEERLSTRQDPIVYGINTNKAMTYTLTFGSDKPLTHLDAEKVAIWLTSHNTYKWLEILQDDLTGLRYKAIITGLETIHINGEPVGFSCTVNTDSQFAYETPKEFNYELGTKTQTIEFNNASASYGYYYPKMEIHAKADSGFTGLSIKNTTDSGRLFMLSDIETYQQVDLIITIDNRNQIITCKTSDTGNDVEWNIYKHFADTSGIPRFLRLLRGANTLEMTTHGGSCKVKFICEFPRKVGL